MRHTQTQAIVTENEDDWSEERETKTTKTTANRHRTHRTIHRGPRGMEMSGWERKQ